MELSGIDRSELVQSSPRGVDKSMLSPGISSVSAFSQCCSVSLRLLDLVCRAYMRALVTCCTALTGCPFKSHEAQKIQASQRFIYHGSGAGVTIERF